MRTLTVEQAAKMLQYSHNGIYRAIQRGELVAVKIGRRYRLSAELIEAKLRGEDCSGDRKGESKEAA